MAKDFDLAAVMADIEASPFDWTAGETALTRMTEAERDHRLGVPLPSKAEVARLEKAGAKVERAALAASADDGVALPAAFNLNNAGGVSYVAGVRNQLGCGSCVAFGSVAALEGTARWTRRMPNLDVDLSEAHLFYGWGASVGRTCDNGWFPEPALGFCTNRGVTFENEWPYSDGNSNGRSLPASWESHRAKSVGVVTLTNNVAGIKQHLNDYGPVAACFIVYADFFAYRGGVYRRTSNDQRGGHCVAIVGYDDAQSAWICKNSWGTGFGEGGFFRIGYGQCGIETWQVVGVRGVNLRTWTGNKAVVGLYASGHDRNAWAYLADHGWLRIGGTTQVAHTTMLTQVAASKTRNRPVNTYCDDGLVTTLYAF